MRIRKRLQLNVAVSVITSIVICLMLFLALQRISGVSSLTKTAGDLMSGMLDRVALRNDYIRNNSGRAKEQWFAKHEQIGALLTGAAAEFRGADDKKKIAEMIEVQQSIGQIFSAIVANREKGEKGAVPAGLAREVEDRLLNQLNMRVYEVAIQSRDLLESAQKARLSVFRQAAWEIIAILLLLIAAAMLNSRSMEKEIADRVARLRKGAVMIGGGDLTHRIDVKGDDELAELSDAFNAMAAKLGGSYRDLEKEIEERRHSEREIQKRENELRLVMNAVPALISYIDAGFHYRRVNGSYEHWFGLKPQDMEGRHVREVLGEETWAIVRPRLESVLAGETITYEELMPYRAGGSRWIAAMMLPHRDETGSVDGIVAHVTDITDCKRAEEELRESEERLRLFIEHAPAGLAMFDREMRYLAVSRRWRNDYKLGDRQLIGVSHYDVFPEIRDEWKTAHRRGLAGEVMSAEADRFVREDGSVQWVKWEVRPWNDAAGATGGIVIFTEDVTDRKLAEETLQDAHDELVRLLDVRTRDLREKEVLLKEIHHRVKNNLQVISSLVGLQADGSKDETIRGVLRDVTDRVRSMALVHERLYQSANLASIDFAEYSRGLLGYLWRAHGSPAIELKLDLSPVSLPVDTAVPLGLILNELAGNTLKHAFKGCSKGEVTVSLKDGAADGILLSVSDDGVGLPAGLDWRQAKSLGLRLVQMLAGQLGATVEVTSCEGTRFEIKFQV